MKNLSIYITHLNFEYAISYSGLRAAEFEQLKKINTSKIKEITAEIKTSGWMKKSNLQAQIDHLAAEINIYDALIIDASGKQHPSTKLVHRFEKGDTQLNQILEILSLKFEEQDYWMCPPVFRDAIVFYTKEDKISGILQMCFSCAWMKNEKGEDLEVDNKIFTMLKHELTHLGHEIENE
jgi:hypothetical protein